ncbi:DUF4178 domain-containing protein [Oscillatoria sp. FACHB-1407]|uniref:DUF4178 domain-containing protein n=1 Tax=Oscillatoria sp. FACHB-1407 TaxID=2692847 RepID=UPI001689A5C0|nr:DUF4178 domain-containing protein [Oscillatoria sp. FACHB-1407]MBD2461935.1 DUF4178 domain-containing protein [Oscillatoria sp. FACHB-1407]
MLPLIWIGIIAIAIVAVILVMRQAQGKSLSPRKATPALPMQRTVFTLQVGDIVQYEGADWVVEGQLTYNSQGYVWLEYLLQDADQIRWLSVEEDDQVEICWLKPLAGLEISRTPPQQITVANVVFQLEESGTAQMTHLGATLNRQAQHCRYFDYSGADHQILSVEDWDGDIEITIGHKIRPSALLLLPGDGRHVYDG